MEAKLIKGGEVISKAAQQEQVNMHFSIFICFFTLILAVNTWNQSEMCTLKRFL